MKRPLGLILSAILLCLAALFLLLMTTVMVFASLEAGSNPSTPPNAPHFFIYIVIFVGLIYLGIAVWDILTAIGILRLRSWGRYSIIAIGACTAFFNLMGIFGLVVSRSAVPPQPGVDPRITQIAFLIFIAVEAIIAAIGVWWVIYFTRPRIRDLFRPAAPPAVVAYDPAAYPTLPPPPYPTPPQKRYTGFFSSPAHAPIAIKILGWLVLVGTVFNLIAVFLPLPAFMLGFIVPVLPSHLLFAVFALINVYIGYGLLKLWNSARLAAIAFMLLGVGNAALSILPWYQEQFRKYTSQYLARFPSMMPTTPGQPPITIYYSSTVIIFYAIMGGVFTLFIIGLLYYYRSAFAPQTQTDAA